MTLINCPEWEYSNVNGASQKLSEASRNIFQWLISETPDSRIDHSRDTRKIHEFLFNNLTPKCFEYYAGHYRGEDFPCLKLLKVGIQYNPLVGSTPDRVIAEMDICSEDIRQSIIYLDQLWIKDENIVPRAAKIRRTAEIIAAIFCSFLIIHPYANGNGHMARFIAIAIFSRFNIFLRRWPIDPRPPDPPYSFLIAKYQNGETEEFIRFLIDCI